MDKYRLPYGGPQSESVAIAQIAIALTKIANEKAIANEIELKKMSEKYE